MLTSSEFWIVMWSIIEEAKGDERRFRRILAKKPEGVIILFEKQFRKALSNLREISMCGSEDLLKDIYAHVVSRGAEFYDEVVAHPERIPQDVGPSDPCYYGVAGDAYFEKDGKELSLD